jgi:hypothetical protein
MSMVLKLCCGDLDSMEFYDSIDMCENKILLIALLKVYIYIYCYIKADTLSIFFYQTSYGSIDK